MFFYRASTTLPRAFAGGVEAGLDLFLRSGSGGHPPGSMKMPSSAIVRVSEENSARRPPVAVWPYAALI